MGGTICGPSAIRWTKVNEWIFHAPILWTVIKPSNNVKICDTTHNFFVVGGWVDGDGRQVVDKGTRLLSLVRTLPTTPQPRADRKNTKYWLNHMYNVGRHTVTEYSSPTLSPSHSPFLFPCLVAKKNISRWKLPECFMMLLTLPSFAVKWQQNRVMGHFAVTWQSQTG